MKKLILSKNFPLLFLRFCCVLILISLFLVLSLLNKYSFCGGFTYFIYAKELLFSAVGTACVAFSAFICLTFKRK